MIKEALKKLIPLPILEFRRANMQEREYRKWINDGCPVPPPAIVKHKTLLSYHKKYRPSIFIETGTYYGGTIEKLKGHFKTLLSIEISKHLFELAKIKFAEYPHIRLYLGDSGELLPDILKEIKEPCLFWLDGHYSGDITGKGELVTPIYKELSAIFENNKHHVILIDDARLFVGQDDYPDLEDLLLFISKHHPNAFIEVKDDMIRITDTPNSKK